MKTLTIITTLLLTLSSFAAAPRLSAFSLAGKLYVTTIVDGCNNHRAGINPIPFCKESRVTKNLAPFCEADLLISSTRMFCGKTPNIAKVFTIDLDESDVAVESETLTLNYAGQSIEVELDR